MVVWLAATKSCNAKQAPVIQCMIAFDWGGAIVML